LAIGLTLLIYHSSWIVRRGKQVQKDIARNCRTTDPGLLSCSWRTKSCQNNSTEARMVSPGFMFAMI